MQAMQRLNPKITERIQKLLALAASEMRLGNKDAACTASGTANEIAAKDGRVRIYTVWPRTSQRVEETMTEETRCVPDFWVYTPDDAWKRSVESATECGVSLVPQDYVVVGCVHAGDVNERGAHSFLPDWADVHDAAALRPLGMLPCSA